MGTRIGKQQRARGAQEEEEQQPTKLLTYTPRNEPKAKTHIIKSMSRVSSKALCGLTLLGIRQYEDRIMTENQVKNIPIKRRCRGCIEELLS